MPADEVHHEDSAGPPRARSGPRHAAPRKPLLTRLHVPAGKAIAIAAMPTAVLMGMGLTPQLAQAKPLPKNPFQDGPCVTAPDDASKDAEKAAEEKAEKEKAEQEKAEQEKADKSGKDDSGKATAEPTPSPSAGDKAGSDPDGSGSPDGSDSSDTAEPTPSESEDKAEEPAPEPSETKNPLDPLGVGDALKDIFTPDEKESASPTPTPSASEEGESSESSGTSGSEESGKDPVKDTVDDVTKPVEDTVDGVKDGVEDGADKAEDEVDKAKEDAEKAADEAAEKAKEEAEDPMAPDENGKKPFPCVVEKKVDGKAEQTPAPIPNQPWHLEASSLTLKGADYQGVVNLTMPNGETKQSLKYVVDSTDIGDLHQIVDGPAGKKYHVQAEKGSTSTIRDGKTTMYTESISGKLFGLIPITFDPEHPPPLNIPLIYFTDVKVKQAGQFGGNLHIPGLRQTITD
ncbi:hypothetical protein GCM10010277_32260 [Streptomyces longisporoflavus]|uniref:hypothetical protein n=1 Tax=Streptomyces longisporoflavus TaxID=28044 RepID=UPI00167D798A|nr:hypothetical protein [Streptomyces longisporoflavus]GGV42928.1 hypothetical protein GCM10010277_32260 [Streptomyces longisporoflavus]